MLNENHHSVTRQFSSHFPAVLLYTITFQSDVIFLGSPTDASSEYDLDMSYNFWQRDVLAFYDGEPLRGGLQ